MRFNLIAKTVHSKSGAVVKKLHCPYKRKQEALTKTADTGRYTCASCHHIVTDVSHFTEPELRKLMSSNPDSCVRIDLMDTSMEIVMHDIG